MEAIWLIVGLVLGAVLYRWGYERGSESAPRDKTHSILQQIENYDGNEGGTWKR